MARKRKPTGTGKMSIADMRAIINKKAGMEVAHNLSGDNPTAVKDWIPTGSRWLDSIICKGSRAGVPVGKVTEIAGLEASGKSFLAAQVAANAQKMGIDVKEEIVRKVMRKDLHLGYRLAKTVTI